MAVFMGTRQNYQLSRYQNHSGKSWFIFWMLLGTIFFSGYYTFSRPQGVIVPGLLITGLCISPKGRKVGRRLVRETFYGCVFRGSGVYHTTGATQVGLNGSEYRDG